MDDQIGEIAKLVMGAVTRGEWALVAVLSVLLLVMGVRRFGGKLWPLLEHPKVAPVVSTIGSAAGAIGTAVLAGAPISWGLIAQGLIMGLAASGTWSAMKTWAEKPPEIKTAEHAMRVIRGPAE